MDSHVIRTSATSRQNQSAPDQAAIDQPAAGVSGIAEHVRAGLRVPLSLTGLLRGLTAAAVVVSADVHFVLWYHDDFREISKIGPLFLLNAIGGLLLGLLVVAWRSWIATFLAAGFGLVTLVAFYLSVTVGLLGLQETAGGGPQTQAEIAEWAALVFGLLATAVLWRQDGTAPADAEG
jgi:hypothetical protein